MAALATATDSARLTMVFQVSGRRGTAGPPPDAGRRSPPRFRAGHRRRAAFATGVGLEMPALAAPVGALAAAVGISRAANGVHYPSDIAGGWAAGVDVGMLTLRWWPLRRSQPAATSAA
jgi:membrane-associated phospholipid phosphatase